MTCVRFEDGVWRLHGEGRSIAIHSRDGQREGDRVAAELLAADPDASFLVVIGLGLGFTLEGLERRGWSGTVLAIEPEPETVEPMLARRDWRAWLDSKRLRLLVAPDFVGASDCWKLFGDGTKTPALWINPALAQARPGEVNQAQALVDRVRSEAQSNHAARQAHAGPYLLHTLRNVGAIASEGDAAALDGAGRGVPAILVGAGPSLDRAIPILRQLQHSAFIIAVDTASTPLFHAGVTPHIVVAVDPAEQNSRHLTELPHSTDTWLVTEGSIDPLAIECFAGRTFFFRVSDHQPWPWLQSQGRTVGLLRAWGSVLTTAFDLALRMDCDPIAFVGADLAFTENRLYARGVTYEHDWRRRLHYGMGLRRQWIEAIDRWPRLTAPDVNGAETRTAAHLVAFRDWLVEQMRREKGRTFINATGAGILHGAGVNVTPDDLPGLLPSRKSKLAGLVRGRYRPFKGQALLAAARTLLHSAEGAHVDPVVERWEAFAPGLSRNRIVEALKGAVTLAPSDPGTLAPSDPGTFAPSHPRTFAPLTGAYASPDVEALSSIANVTTLVPMRIPPHRMERAPNGARRLWYRTATARIIACAIRSPDGAVLENGQPLARALDFDHIVPGSYVISRDDVQFRATDDSDPRTNGREYSVLVPPSIDYIENLPVEEILRRDL